MALPLPHRRAEIFVRYEIYANMQYMHKNNLYAFVCNICKLN